MMATRGNQRIRVLEVITDLDIGGGQKLLAQLAAGLSRNKYNVKVSCFFDAGYWAERIEQSGIHVEELRIQRKSDLAAVVRLYRFVRTFDPHIINSHLFHPDQMFTVIGKLAGIPILISTRQSVEIGGPTRELINRFLTPLRDANVAVSRGVKQTLLDRARARPERVVLIPNRIDIREIQDPDLELVEYYRKKWLISGKHRVVGTIARLVKAKGLEFLVAGINILERQYSDLKVIIVGSGPLESQLKSSVLERDLAEKVIFPGYSTDIAEILSLMDIYVLPSLWEGLPLAVLEAMAAGKPVIASAVGGVPEVVIDGETGILVPPKDPDALAMAINTLLSDPDLAQRMGEAGRLRAIEHFDISITIKETEALYDHLIEENLGLVYKEGAGWVKV